MVPNIVWPQKTGYCLCPSNLKNSLLLRVFQKDSILYHVALRPPSRDVKHVYIRQITELQQWEKLKKQESPL
jgi:hypothetical protein